MMTATEIKQATEILKDHVQRIDTAIDGDGQCLTAHWLDGGQKIFYSLRDVELWRDERAEASDTRKSATGTITWYEDKTGIGRYLLEWEDGSREEVQGDEPITAKTDSHEVAGMFNIYGLESVDHDGEYIHVTALN